MAVPSKNKNLLKLSSHSHVIPVKKGVFALWNSLWLRTIFIADESIDLIRHLQEGTRLEDLLSIDTVNKSELFELISAIDSENFFESSQDAKKIQEIRAIASAQPISIMYLILSKSCNLRCTYCYVSDALSDKTDDSLMQRNTAEKAIDLFSELIKESPFVKPKIIFYGGEPLLNLPTLEFALEYASKKISNCEFSINSNGLLVNESVAKLLHQYNVAVGLSMDGQPEIHDKFRKNHANKGTFSKVLKTYNLLREQHVPVSISCTVTSINAEKLPSTTQWFLDELNPDVVDFNLLIGKYAGDEYAENATSGIIESYKLLRDKGVYVDKMLRRVKAFVNGEIRLFDCGGSGQQIVCTPDDKIGVCQAFLNSGEYFYPIEEMTTQKIEKSWSKWKQRTPFNIEACLGCEALGICGGGCYYSSYIESGDIMSLDKKHCILVKKTLRLLLSELFDEQSSLA